MKNVKKLELTWQDYYLLIRKLIFEIEEKYMDYKILAISRGGLIPATMISHWTFQKIDVIDIFSYNNRRQSTDAIIKPFNKYDNEIPKKILIVDDLIDSGNTLFNVYKLICNKINQKKLNLHDFSLKSVVLIDKCESIIKPNYSAKQLEKNYWVKFPYERE